MNKYVAIIDGNQAYHEMFEAHGWTTLTENEMDVDPISLICFTGGADVSPELYGQKKIPGTFTSPKRDEYEKEIFDEFVGKIPMVGICRGAQFLNVMCGGGLWQDVDGHTTHGGHDAIDLATGYKFKVSSTHHQMMRCGNGATLLAYATEAHNFYDDSGHYSKMDRIKQEYEELDEEVVHYPEQKVLCFQPHPEFKGFAECTKAFFNYLKLITQC